MQGRTKSTQLASVIDSQTGHKDATRPSLTPAEQEFAEHLRLSVLKELSTPGFTQIYIDFDCDHPPHSAQQWHFNLGVSPFSSAPAASGCCELAVPGRWRLHLRASYIKHWLADHTAQLELKLLSVQVLNLVASMQVRRQIRLDYQSYDYWYGYSRALQAIETLLKQYAQLQLPLVLVGEKGTGKLPAAMSLHCYRHAAAAPFIRSDCRAWEPNSAAKQLHDLAQQARGGSLYLAHTECLQGPEQTYLRDFVTRPKADFMLILGSRCVADIDALTAPECNEFLAWAEFHCVCVRLPRLQERVHDIRAFVQGFLTDNQLDLSINPAALAVLEAYSWPENACQLQSVLRKSAHLVTNELCDQQLLNWFPALRCQSLQLVKTTETAIPQAADFRSLSHISKRRHSFQAWFGVTQPELEHPALMRALEHIWINYPQPLALNNVAAKACVSPSHLSYLFKQRLQRSFKQILTEIRIDKAKHIFENMPARQITQVCIDVGFADLSHFEKTFKRVVGLNPRCYRQQFRQPLSTQS